VVVERSDPNQKLTEGIFKTSERMDTAYSRLEKVEKQLNLVPEKSKTHDVVSFLSEYDQLVNGFVPSLIILAFQISDLVEDQIDKLYTALTATRALLNLTSECKKSSDWDGLCTPIAKLIAEIVDISERNRSSIFSEHLSIVSKVAPSLAWIASSTPANHIQQFRTATESLITKFVKDHRGRENYITFVESYSEFWKQLEAYVLKNHTSGLTWNQTGKDAPHLLKFPKRGYPYGSSKGIPPKLHVDNSSNRWYCEHQTGSKIVNIEGEKNILVISEIVTMPP